MMVHLDAVPSGAGVSPFSFVMASSLVAFSATHPIHSSVARACFWAHGDVTQLIWMASAIALLSFILWAVLHFGFVERLARSAHSVEAFGEGKSTAPEVLGGGDEVAAFSGKFAAMATRLRERETE